MKNNLDVSILIPAIRTHNWVKMYETILKSCKRYSFELILVSPFDLPDELKDKKNIKLIKDYSHPTRAAQNGSQNCEGRLLFHCVDDALFFEDSIDESIDLYNKTCKKYDVVNMRYREGHNYSGYTYPLEIWNANYHSDLKLPGISNNWKISLHHLISTDFFRELGGWDCQFQYLNHALHDLMFRVQAYGGTIYNSPNDVTTCDHYPERTEDHGPIHDAQLFHDKPIFEEIYSNTYAAFERIKIDYENWKKYPEFWSKRKLEKLPKTYEEMMENNK